MACDRRPHELVTVLVLVAACSSEAATPALDTETTDTTDTTVDPPDEDDRLLILPPLRPCEPGAEPLTTMRVTSWNISAGRISSLDEIRSVVMQQQADVLVLQELDVLVRRTGSVDQPRVLAEALGYPYAFAASLEFDGGDFGMAVLSRLPFAEARRISLPSEGGYEPRIALDVTLCAGPQPLRVVDVHADFVPEVNATGLTALAQQLGSTRDAPTIIAGDLNATDDAEGVRALITMTDAIDVLQTWDPGPTRDDERIDFVLVSPELAEAVTDATRVQTDASDHLPLRVDVALP